MKKIILSLLLFVSLTTYGQDFLLSEQWFSRINRNPAAIGNNSDINLFYMNRKQWVGFKESPSTNMLNAHAFFEGISSGVGLIYNYDTEGLGDRALNAKLAYSYQTPIAKNMVLAFGVSAGIMNKAFDPDKFDYENNDIRPDIENESKTNFDMDLGVEFSMPVFMAGFAVDHLLNNRKDMLNTTTSRQFTGYVRGNIGLGTKFNLAPALVYNNYTSNAPDFLEFNATLFYDKMFWFGLGTRFDDGFNFMTLDAMIGIEWKMLRIGYGYDYSLGDLGNFKKSSHEIMLSLKIPKCGSKKTQQKFVRFMD